MSAVIISPAVEIIQPTDKKENDNDSDHVTDDPISQESIKTQNSQKSEESWTNITKMMAGKVVKMFYES